MKYEMLIDNYDVLDVFTTANEAAGYDYTLKSTNTWIEATANAQWSKRRGSGHLVFDNKMWTFGGWDITNVCINDVWYSIDGITWTQATANAQWSKRRGFGYLVFDNKMWLFGGYDKNNNHLNDVWYSTDGITWTLATANAQWIERHGFGELVFDNKMWLFGGWDERGNHLNDVWYSTDGITWTLATANAQWSKRRGHGDLVFDNKMWIFGGWDTVKGYNDVWYSTDGITWTQATANAQWSERYGFGHLVFDNKMWMFGGHHRGKSYNDVWYSTDGITWTQSTANAQWNKRRAFGELVFDNRMWLFGGYDFNSIYLNDVWYFTGKAITSKVTPQLSLASMDTGAYEGRYSRYATASGGTFVQETKSAFQVQNREVIMSFNIVPDNPDVLTSNKWFGKYLTVLQQVDGIRYNAYVDLLRKDADLTLDLKYQYHSVEWLEHNMIGILTVVYYDVGNGWHCSDSIGPEFLDDAASKIYDGTRYDFMIDDTVGFNKRFNSVSPVIQFFPDGNVNFPDWFFISGNNGNSILYIDFRKLTNNYKGTPFEYFTVDAVKQEVECKVKNNDTVIDLKKFGGVMGLEQFKRIYPPSATMDVQGYPFVFICSHDKVMYLLIKSGNFYLEM